jgi:alkaline phosphatase D
VSPPSRPPALGALLVLLALTGPLAPTGAARAQDPARLLVTVGDVTETSAVLWARGVREGELAVEHRAAHGPTRETIAVSVDPHSDLTAKVMLRGLPAGTRISYRVRQAGDSVQGEFVTAPGPDSPAPARFLWSGDLGGGRFCRRQADGYPIFRAMARHPVDFFLFVGDTIYADRRCNDGAFVPGYDFVARSLGEFRDKHRYNRADPAVQVFYQQTSVYAIWDDHDVRGDFAPSDPLMPIGRRAFLDYWPIEPPAADPTRLYRRFRWGRLLELFILDTRQYRSANTEPDGPAKTMLGEAQRRWLVENVSASSATWKVVVSSVSLSVPGLRQARDSWSNANILGFPEEGSTGFAAERQEILAAFRTRGVRNVVVLTADVHHGELIEHRLATDYRIHEFIAGPLSQAPGRPRPLDQALNPRSIAAVAGMNNFGEIAIDPEELRVRLVGEDGRELAAHRLRPE